MQILSLKIVYAIFLLLFYAVLAYGRNMVWMDEYSLCFDAVINSPDKVRSHLNFANALVTVGLPERAIKEYHSVLEKDPRQFNAYIGIGGANLVMKNWEKALIAYNQALSIQPDSSIARTNLGIVYMNTKRIDKAIEEFKTAITLWPDNELARQNLIYLDKQRTSQ